MRESRLNFSYFTLCAQMEIVTIFNKKLRDINFYQMIPKYVDNHIEIDFTENDEVSRKKFDKRFKRVKKILIIIFRFCNV